MRQHHRHKPLPFRNINPMKTWSIYLLRDETNGLYTGISTDVRRRYLEHLQKTDKGAKYTRSKKQLVLVYSCEVGGRSLASQVEYRVKRLAKKDKEGIVKTDCGLHELLVLLELGTKS